MFERNESIAVLVRGRADRSNWNRLAAEAEVSVEAMEGMTYGAFVDRLCDVRWRGLRVKRGKR